MCFRLWAGPEPPGPAPLPPHSQDILLESVLVFFRLWSGPEPPAPLPACSQDILLESALVCFRLWSGPEPPAPLPPHPAGHAIQVNTRQRERERDSIVHY